MQLIQYDEIPVSHAHSMASMSKGMTPPSRHALASTFIHSFMNDACKSKHKASIMAF